GAVVEAKAAAELDPIDPEARVVLSQAQIDAALHLPAGDPGRRGRLDQAVLEAETAVRLDPWTANRRAALALARAAGGDAVGAYAEMAAASRLNPFRPLYAGERDRLRAILTEGPEESAPAPGGGR